MSFDSTPQVIRARRNRERNAPSGIDAVELDATPASEDDEQVVGLNGCQHNRKATLALVRPEDYLGYFSTR
jgi:hypothetical protein